MRGMIIILLLQMRKLRMREVKMIVSSETAGCNLLIPKPALILLSPVISSHSSLSNNMVSETPKNVSEMGLKGLFPSLFGI